MVIQRLQSLYLLIATVAMGIFCSCNFYSGGQGEMIAAIQLPVYFYPGIIGGLLSLIAIFLFKNFSMQIKVVSLAWIIAVVLDFMFLFGVGLPAETYEIRYNAPMLLSAAVLFDWLAIMNIRHDRKLLADSNRLR